MTNSKKRGVFRSLIDATLKLLISLRAFKTISVVKGITYVAINTIAKRKYFLSLEITCGVNDKNKNTPKVGITIGCNKTDMSL